VWTVQQVRRVIHFLVFLTKYTRIGRSVLLAISDPAELIAALNGKLLWEFMSLMPICPLRKTHFRHAKAEGMANHAVTTGRRHKELSSFLEWKEPMLR
jgi:hypothetical protein